MPFKGAKAYVNISKVSMIEAAEDLCLNSIQENLKTLQVELQFHVTKHGKDGTTPC